MKRKYRGYKDRVNSINSINKRCPACNLKLQKIEYEFYAHKIIRKYRNPMMAFGNEYSKHINYNCNSCGTFIRFNAADIGVGFAKMALGYIAFEKTSHSSIYINQYDVFLDFDNQYQCNISKTTDLKYLCNLYKRYKENICLS
jgi:hypothetical protein